MLTTRAILSALLLATASAKGQDAPAREALPDTVGHWKSPAKARMAAIIPGRGHLYAGEHTRGRWVAGAVLAVGLVGAAYVITDCLEPVSSKPCGSDESVVGASALLGVWGWSIYDAGRAAVRANTRRAAAGPDRASRDWRIGVSVGTW